MERDGFGAVALGFETSLAGAQLSQALHQDGEIRLGDGLVEPHHHIARLYAIAVAHAQLADDAAGRVLNFLDVRIDHDEARCDDGAGKLSRRGKPANAPGEQSHDGDPADQMALDRALRFGYCSHNVPPQAPTTFSPVAPAASCGASRPSAAMSAPGRRLTTLLNTSSFGPKAWTRPSPITSRRSTAASALGRCAITTTIWPRARADMMDAVSACSPSASRFEFGSSSTTRNGSR